VRPDTNAPPTSELPYQPIRQHQQSEYGDEGEQDCVELMALTKHCTHEVILLASMPKPTWILPLLRIMSY
jgi:hypothetical protein